jgi:hypothetical protein
MASAGCRKTRVSQPLAHDLRGPVNDLAAVLAGDNLSLVWTMPKKKTATLVLNGRVSVRVCRRESATGPCTELGEPILLAPGAAGSFSEELPAALRSGSPRVLFYFVELLDRNGSSTGLSNSVATLAGAPLPAVQDLTAELTKEGVILRWKPASTTDVPTETTLRLHSTEIILKTPAAGDDAHTAEPEEHDLWIKDDVPSKARDKNIHLGKIYEYTAQRIVRLTVERQHLEMAGQLSAPVRLDTGVHP